MVLMSVTEKALHGLLRCPIPLVLNKTQTTCHMKKNFSCLFLAKKIIGKHAMWMIQHFNFFLSLC